MDNDIAAIITLGVPEPFKPRTCAPAKAANTTLLARCPGLPGVRVTPSDTAVAQIVPSASVPQIRLDIAPVVGSTTAFVASVGDQMHSTAPRHREMVTSVAAARSELLRQFARYGDHNETYAGMQTAISWNVIFTPYEGIFTPVFRGSPWDVSKPHNYVLFEWDTYLSSLLASVTDLWTAKSNIIRMTKSLIFKGYVAGFWNGLCGEVDKSKPPVGGLALELMLRRHPEEAWMGELLLPQLVMWNRWWAQTRQFSPVSGAKNTTVGGGLLAPGSTRANVKLAISCEDQSPVGASRCETGLDNSPLYDDAKFVSSEDVINSVDVGMTALYARDCLALAAVCARLGARYPCVYFISICHLFYCFI